ncbi:uncharacterized protein G2W53_023056 [Senna tora]|uniref:Uncharacterized protein n=1 Tax=Senna tora TaxID=362788 RepID=A0A834TNS6_9FABA|nr:uncharacterized protein G2W53_023056 [Senna tora]
MISNQYHQEVTLQKDCSNSSSNAAKRVEARLENDALDFSTNAASDECKNIARKLMEDEDHIGKWMICDEHHIPFP